MSRFKIDEHKLLYHVDRVHEWQHGNPRNVFPIYVEISPVGYCNHRCTFCALDYLGYKDTRLRTTTLKGSIMSMALHGVRSIMFAGEGEPLLHPDLSEVVEWTDRNGVDAAITTNAVPLTRRFCDQALKHCTWIKVSCNAGDEHTYAKVHRCSHKDWHKVWKNIKYAIDLRDATPGNKTTIGVQAVLLPENAKSMNALARKCKEIGVDYLTIKPYSQHGMSLTHQYEDIDYSDAYDKYLNALKMFASSKFEIITRHSTMESWNEEDRKKEYSRCLSVPFFWAYIMASGDVYGCSAFLGDNRFRYGNINEKTFAEIWLGDRRRCAINFIQSELDIAGCRKNCRMHKINAFLHDIKHPSEHKNFI